MGRVRLLGMRSIFVVVGLVLALCVGPVFASGTITAPQTTAPGWMWSASNQDPNVSTPSTGYPFATQTAAMQTACSTIPAGAPFKLQYGTGGPGNQYCDALNTSTSVVTANAQQVFLFTKSVTQNSCPANSTSTSPGVCTCTDPATPNAGGTACQLPADPCASDKGVPHVANFTVGWKQSATDGRADVVGDYSAVPGSSCVNRCGRTFTNVPNSYGQMYYSTEAAATGLYRMSFDVTTVGTGLSCTAPLDKGFDPTTPPPPCPGFVGQVNGKIVCVGTGNSPLAPPSNPASAPQAPVTGGNPAAGDMPTTGQGSGSGGAGRTPLLGGAVPGGGGGGAPGTGGGTAGGGSGAASGSLGQAGGVAGGAGGAGSGTAGDPYRAKDPCGIPGGPKCGIDETGTPNGVAEIQGLTTSFTAAGTALTSAVTSAGSSAPPLKWQWLWPVPQGVCTPLDFTTRLGSMTINPCTSPGINMLRDLLGYFLYIWGALYVWRSATAAAGGGGR